MMTLEQLEKAARRCETQIEALELVRNETAARVAAIEGMTEENARITTLGAIAYVTGNGMPREEAARLMALFKVQHPYFGGDITRWPESIEDTLRMGYEMGKAAARGEAVLYPVEAS